MTPRVESSAAVGTTFMTHDLGEKSAAANPPTPAFMSMMFRYRSVSSLWFTFLYAATCSSHRRFSSSYDSAVNPGTAPEDTRGGTAVRRAGRRRRDARLHVLVPDVVGVGGGVARADRRRPGRALGPLAPDADLVDLGDLLPAERGGVLLDPLLLGGEVGLRALPRPVVGLPVDGRAGEYPVAAGPQHAVDLHHVHPAVAGPGDEAAGAVRHVEGARREGELDGADHADEGRHAALQSELHLRLVRVARRERHGDHAAGVEVRAQARHLQIDTQGLGREEKDACMPYMYIGRHACMCVASSGNVWC
jgi:hypothetical protein